MYRTIFLYYILLSQTAKSSKAKKIVSPSSHFTTHKHHSSNKHFFFIFIIHFLFVCVVHFTPYTNSAISNKQVCVSLSSFQTQKLLFLLPFHLFFVFFIFSSINAYKTLSKNNNAYRNIT